MSSTSPIKVLPPEVARKIAAGEVIDRPNAIVRELMDNAIDSGADSITVELYNGGIDKIRVMDNGSGMAKADLEIAATPHATSKISSEQDLLNLSTLGFRGEALSSIAAVSELTIISGEYKLESNVLEKNKITPCQPYSGTIVQSENLFQNFPARRMFLKRPATESKMCQNTFIEKALPFYNIEFRLFVDGELKIDLPKEKTLKDRFITANDYASKKDLFFTVSNSAKDNSWNYNLVVGEPAVSRSDRKEISIYVNNRKIVEYALLQAIEYGCQGYFPNGTHPVATLFVTIESDLVDFNIHPAKKEVRFKDISELHHSVSSTTRNFFRDSSLKSIRPELDSSYYENTFQSDFFAAPISDKAPDYTEKKASGSPLSNITSPSQPDMRSIFMSNTSSSYANHLASLASEDEENRENSASIDAAQDPEETSLNETSPSHFPKQEAKYFGTVLGTFLAVEKGNTLYLIDQHAAHERILYDNLMTNTSRSQKLLVPYEIETASPNDDSYLESIVEPLEDIGFTVVSSGNGKWTLTAVNERWTGTEEEFFRQLLDKKVSADRIMNSIAAMTACKAAVKDGYYLDEITALELAEKALALPDPHCPHGRPIWTAITREKLFELVKRT